MDRLALDVEFLIDRLHAWFLQMHLQRTDITLVLTTYRYSWTQQIRSPCCHVLLWLLDFHKWDHACSPLNIADELNQRNSVRFTDRGKLSHVFQSYPMCSKNPERNCTFCNKSFSRINNCFTTPPLVVSRRYFAFIDSFWCRETMRIFRVSSFRCQ